MKYDRNLDLVLLAAKAYAEGKKSQAARVLDNAVKQPGFYQSLASLDQLQQHLMLKEKAKIAETAKAKAKLKAKKKKAKAETEEFDDVLNDLDTDGEETLAEDETVDEPIEDFTDDDGDGFDDDGVGDLDNDGDVDVSIDDDFDEDPEPTAMHAKRVKASALSNLKALARLEAVRK